MKKFKFFGMMAVAAMAVSCSSDDVVQQVQEDNAIQFSTYLGNAAQSRGSVVTTGDMATQGFGVYAYYTANVDFNATTHVVANFMNNQKVTGTGSEGSYTWTYSPIKYWPNNEGDKVSFFAYAPYNENGCLNASKPGQIDFEVVNPVADHIDLLWNRSETANLTKKSITGTVDFNFAHALARIGLTVQTAVDQIAVGGELAENTTITVKKVMLTGAAHTYVAGVATVSTTGAFYQTGVLDMNNPSSAVPAVAKWSEQAGTQSFTWNPADNFESNAEVKLTGASVQTKLNNDNSYAMVIPQDFSQTPFYVYVEYEVATVDENNPLNNSTITNYISTPVYLNLESGKAYSLNLSLGMTSVKITADIENWVDVPVEVDVPENFN